MNLPEVADLIEGAPYYECRILRLDTRYHVVVRSWKYIGYRQNENSSSSCESPFHFHEFVAIEDHPSRKPESLLFPTLALAKEQLFTWSVLVSAINAINCRLQAGEDVRCIAGEDLRTLTPFNGE